MCLCLILNSSVNALSMFEQNSLPLSVTFYFRIPNFAIKLSSMDPSIVVESLDATGVIVRKSEKQPLITSMELLSRKTGSGLTGSMCAISNHARFLGKLLSVWRLCRDIL